MSPANLTSACCSLNHVAKVSRTSYRRCVLLQPTALHSFSPLLLRIYLLVMFMRLRRVAILLQLVLSLPKGRSFLPRLWAEAGSPRTRSRGSQVVPTSN